nr:MAG: RNA-dependent RNA polymerase [Mitoviridae sp.]
MTENSTVNSMCKSAQAMGMSKKKWYQIEDNISNILESSGPQFMINYLKDLKEYHEARLIGNEPPDLHWHSKNAKGEPDGWQRHLSFRKPKTSIQVIGAMVTSIKHDTLQSSQLDKWIGAVRMDPPEQPTTQSTNFFVRSKKKDTDYVSRIGSLEDEIFADLDYMPKYKAKKFTKNPTRARDEDLAKLIASQSLFSPEDITGTSIPMFETSLRISSKKDKKSKVRVKSLEQTLQAYVASINSAPAFAGQMEIDRIKLVQEHFPHIRIKDLDERLELAEKVKANGQNLVIESWSDEPDPLLTPRFAMNQRVGHIAFLQQAGGKLRAIANPNRYLQHLMRPLQEHMSEVNHHPCVSVLDQDEGIRWAQSKLQKGDHLSSFDLSSATDTLQAAEFLENSAAGDITENELINFNFASKAYWFSPDLDSDVNWSVGQPLGLAPSFSTLTLMNLTAGIRACELNEIPRSEYRNYFRVVGDDFVCDSRIAPEYTEVISDMGGIVNLEKTLQSDKYAEFCSQMITPQGSWPLKPKIRGTYDSLIVDSEKGSFENVDRSVRRPSRYRKTAEFLSSYSSSDLKNLPSIVSSDQRSFVERLAASYTLGVASQVEATSEIELREIAVGPATRYSIEAIDPIPENDILRHMTEGVSPVDEILSNPSVRMKVDQTVQAYNYKVDRYEPVVSLMDSSSSIAATFEEIARNTVLSDDNSMALVSIQEDDTGSSLSVLLDLSRREIIVEGDTDDISDTFSVDLRETYAHVSSNPSSFEKEFNDVYRAIQSYYDRSYEP